MQLLTRRRTAGRRARPAQVATLGRRFAGMASIKVVEFASGNMYGPVPTLAALAELGISRVEYHLVDKECGLRRTVPLQPSTPNPNPEPSTLNPNPNPQPQPQP